MNSSELRQHNGRSGNDLIQLLHRNEKHDEQDTDIFTHIRITQHLRTRQMLRSCHYERSLTATVGALASQTLARRKMSEKKNPR